MSTQKKEISKYIATMKTYKYSNIVIYTNTKKKKNNL